MPILPRRLNSRIILVVSCILLVTGAVSGWLAARKEAEELLETMRQTSSVIVRNLAESCTRFLLVEDYADLETFLINSAKLPGIQRLQVAEPDGRLIWTVERTPDGDVRAATGIARITPPASLDATATVDTALVIWQPIVAGKPLGWLRVEYGLDHIRQAQERTWRNTLLVTLGWVVFSSLLIILLLRPIVRSIARLTAFAQGLNEHKGEQIVVDGQVHELAELGASLNDASAKLQAGEHQLLAQSESLRNLNRKLRAISRCNEALIHAEDEQTLLADICRIVCGDAGYQMAWVGYAENDDARSVRPVAWDGVEDGYLKIADITWADGERGRGPTGTAIRSGIASQVEDYATDPRVAPWRKEALQRGYHSSISLPLKDDRANTFGALTIYARESGAFTPDQMRLLEELADDLAFGITVLRAGIERRRVEEQVRRLNMELERRVAERTAQLEAANEGLKSFSYSVSHDLRAPLRALHGFAHLLMEDEAANLSAEGRNMLDRIWKNAEKMGKLIDDVLQFSRIGFADMNRKALDMTLLARGVVEELRAEYPTAQVVVGELPRVEGDEAMLRQVWVNLIGNALKFSAKRERPEIAISSERRNDETVFFIRDNGAGFDMAHAGKLFGVFQRMHSESDFPGTGAGLSIVKRIVERHGGRIWAEAEVDKGAIFRFTLSRP
ncbi:MAG: ATP-binding protein [Sterolibacteriaceae bacterium MAG5]|nr:ATP-binding protein [Candidatus Nitricoxidireducens bremensis]